MIDLWVYHLYIRLFRKILAQMMHSCFLVQRKVAATVAEIFGEKNFRIGNIIDC